MSTELDIVQDKDRKRYALLMKLWEAANGSEVNRVNFTNISKQAGLSFEEQCEYYSYFDGEGFFSSGDAGGGIVLSHRAIKEIEQSIRSPSRPTEHFKASVIQYFNAPIGSVQTGAQSYSNVMQHFGPNATELLALIRELRESFEALPLGERGETLQVVDALNEEVASQNPRKGRVKAYLTQLGSVAIKVGSEALLSTIAKQLMGAA